MQTKYNSTVDRSYLSPGVRRLQELAQKFNRSADYRGIGASLGGPGSDAVIMAVGAQRALSTKASETPERAAQ